MHLDGLQNVDFICKAALNFVLVVPQYLVADFCSN